MYLISKIDDTVRIPPSRFDEPLEEVASEIIALFERYAVAPQAVVIEITEEQAFSNSGSSIKNIQQLRDYGFRIAIDDFGTG